MNRLDAYRNSIWLADGERFQPFVARAMAHPCPTAKDIAKVHRKAMKAAGELLPASAQMERLRVYGVEAGSGVDEIREIAIAELAAENLELATHGLTQEIRDSASLKVYGDGVRAEAPRAIRAVKERIGIIEIAGPVAQRMSGELEKAQGTPLDFVSHAFDMLMANASVGAIVLRFSSPGGEVYGVQELADKIYNARSRKTVYAHADSLMASAAYWLGSAASMVIASPGADVGSVGVYVLHFDESAAMEKEGVKISMIHAGKNKVEFSPFAPLSDEARAEAQSRVDSIYDRFTGALSRNFDVPVSKVRSDFGQGRVVSADKALAAGMVHRVMPFESLISKLTGGKSERPQGPSAEKLLALHEMEMSDD